MSNILVCSDTEHATILAALRLLQSHIDAIDPSIADIATNNGEHDLPDDSAIDLLCESINRQEPDSVTISEALKEHFTFGDLVALFGVDSEKDPYAVGATEKGLDDFQVDPITVVSRGDDSGAYVMGWIWVSDDEAGIKPQTELLVSALMIAQRSLKKPSPLAVTDSYRRSLACLKWLDQLTDDFADHLNTDSFQEINLAPPVWIDGDGKSHSEAPSAALITVLGLAQQGGLGREESEALQQYITDTAPHLDNLKQH